MKNRRQRGSAILEAALVVLPLMALGFAWLDFSVAFFVQNVLRNAVREGARFAITQPSGPNGQDEAIKAAVQTNALGFLSSTGSISITYLDQRTLTPVTGLGSNSPGNTCIIAINNYHWSWMAPIWRAPDGAVFNAASSDVMEAPPNGILPTR